MMTGLWPNSANCRRKEVIVSLDLLGRLEAGGGKGRRGTKLESDSLCFFLTASKD